MKTNWTLRTSPPGGLKTHNTTRFRSHGPCEGNLFPLVQPHWKYFVSCV